MVLFCSLKNVENYLMKLLLTCYSKPFLKMLVFGMQKNVKYPVYFKM